MAPPCTNSPSELKSARQQWHRRAECFPHGWQHVRPLWAHGGKIFVDLGGPDGVNQHVIEECIGRGLGPQHAVLTPEQRFHLESLLGSARIVKKPYPKWVMLIESQAAAAGGVQHEVVNLAQVALQGSGARQADSIRTPSIREDPEVTLPPRTVDEFGQRLDCLSANKIQAHRTDTSSFRCSTMEAPPQAAQGITLVPVYVGAYCWVLVPHDGRAETSC